jgi:alkylhydroperoxidase family enzyme
MVHQPRIDPLEPPYEPDVAARLEAMMPAGVPPIALFRTFAKNLPMAKAMGPWGSYELSKQLSLSLREREIVIDRTCARCGCEYEWGVHIAFFADRAGLNTEQVTSLTHGQPTDQCWTQASDRLLIEAVDSMHESGGLPDDVFEKLASIFTEAQILDLAMLCGWYHAISFTANVSRVQREPGAPQFSDF